MSNEDKARKYVNGYMGAGTALVVAAVLPGMTSAALGTIELTMCYHIGRIYCGDTYSWNDAKVAFGVIGLAGLAAKAVALEALNAIPGPGWLIKAPLAGAVIKALGEATIHYYESLPA